MPTYDYECRDCGYIFEHFQMMSDEPLSECPSCGGSVRRLIGGGLGVIFKGSGFYVTDNKSAKSSTAKPVESAKNNSKDTGSSDTASEAPKKKKEEPIKS